MRQTLRLFAGAALVAAAAAGLSGQQGAPPQQAAPAAPQRGPQGVPAQANGECPPGHTLVRIGRCQAPEFPAPSILDYRPKSTLVTAEHLVPRAKFPVVDIHSHQTVTAANMPQLIQEMDALNLRVLNNLSGGSGEELKRNVAAIRASAHRDRFSVFANVNLRGVAPGWGAKAAAQFEEDIRSGAVGLKIYKDLGMTAMKADGTRLAIDDPELDPVWAAAGRLNVPVLIHTAEPPSFYLPPDYTNERWLELALFPSRRNYDPSKVKFEQLIAERDRMFAKHPKTRFIAAHFAYHGHDLATAAALLERLPNVYLEVAAVLYDFGRQPRAAATFFTKYQDRVMFGKDSYAPAEYPYYWRVFETADEYFGYYRDYHAMWKLYGMDLSDDVLRKLYYGNALKVAPGLPQDGWR
ncbi:MAG: amidohydrolase family protein [Acidobacteriota bacterium]|nr:amidohydrolase family protein [Acidobacteriota bacterium]